MIDALYDEYTRLMRVIQALDGAQIVTAGALGAWSVKDILAHLIFWTRFPVAEVSAALRGEPHPFDHSDPNAINAQSVEVYAYRPAQDAVRDFVSAFWSTTQFLRDLPDAAFEPGGAVEQALGDSLSGAFGNNTWEHYALHRADIEAWLARKKFTVDSSQSQ
jgi:hypothetical protein